MSRHEQKRVPNKGTAAYQIGEVLMRNGPMTINAIFTIVPFGSMYLSKRREMVDRWIENGWLEMGGDKLALTEFALDHLEGKVPSEPVFIGIPATSCLFNMMARPPYKTPRTYRREGPEWAQRPEGFGFKSAMGAREVAL